MESAVLRCGRRCFGALEQHLPCALECHAVELSECLVFGRDELPQIKSTSLARKNSVDEHDLDYVDKLDVLVNHTFDTILKPGQLRRLPLGQALLLPGGEPHGNSGSEFGGRRPVGVARLGDVEPPRLPPFHGLHKGAVKLGNIGHPAHHGASALYLLAAHDLRLHTEDS